jgi:serine/threonine-protein kinase
MTLQGDYWANSGATKDSMGHEYCYVPENAFMFGRERHPVVIKAPFYISKFPVTRADFCRFLGETGHEYGQEWRKIMNTVAPQADCPATPVSWDDAKAYVRWLRAQTGEYYSLPTEWEWEVAATGGESRSFPWGLEEPTPDHAAYSTEFPREQTSPVGMHLLGETAHGCHDMAGNVWEWCLDGFDDHNQIHVLRGGSFMDDIEALACTTRRYAYPSSVRVCFAGFRVIYLPGKMFEVYRDAHAVADAPVQTFDGTQTIMHPPVK